MSNEDLAKGPDVVHREDLDHKLAELVDFAKTQASEIRSANMKRMTYTTQPAPPDVEKSLTEALRLVLEDEVVPATQTDQGSVGINEWEIHAELMKKALIRLKAGTLKEIAQERRLQSSGHVEDLATRIASSLHWDEAEVARLVMDYEAEPPEITGHVSHLFPLEEAVNLEVVRQRLDYVLNRYIRIGVARWFAFESVRADDEGDVTIRGSLHSYKAHIDETGETPRLAPEPTQSPATARVRGQSKILEIVRSTTAASRGAIHALRSALGLATLDYVPMLGSVPSGPGTDFSKSSLFMLDVLFNRLGGIGFRRPDLTVLRFKMSETASRGDEGIGEKPVLKAVRFDGNHLLDSIPTCRLLVEGRDLVDVSMTLTSLPRNDGESWTFPVRISIDRDHVGLTTGFGVGAPLNLSRGLNDVLLEVLNEEITEGIANPSRLGELCGRIQERAKSPGEAERANILESGAS
jgi:hypothetical protein